MNISTQVVINHMKEQLKRLEQANRQKDTTQVNEAIAVIEAYCQLFKNGDEHSTRVDKQQPPVEKVTYPSYQQVQTTANTDAPIVHDQRAAAKGNESNLGNLLDF